MPRLPALPPALLLGLCTCAPAGPPNLLLITVDTLRPDRLACYGGPEGVGIAICGLAERGTRFDWALSTAPTTSPAIASLLTSRWVPQHGVTQNLETVLDEELETVTERLRAGGYTTAAVVSNPVLHRRRRLDQGFAHYDHRMTRREPNRPGFAERDARATSDAALEWARRQAREPWFLWVHYQDPHGPYQPPGAPRARDAPGSRRLPLLADDSGRGGIPRYQVLAGARSPEAYEGRYLDEIRYLDGEVARLLEGLDALGRPPAVLLTADHGEALGEDGYWFAHGHSAGLDQLAVPLLYRPAAGGGKAARVAAPVGLVDVAPSLLLLAGLEPPEGFVGRPLPLDGREPRAGRALYAEAGRQAAVVRDRDYYARDRRPGATATMEGRPWGDEHPGLEPRAAHLGPAGRLPAYVPPGDELAELEPLLARFLAEHPAHPGRFGTTPAPEALRRRLRALGYATD